MLAIQLLTRSPITPNRGIIRIQPDQTVIRIGRATDNDVVINDPYTDPYHAELRRNDQGYWTLHDLGSLNGTQKLYGQMVTGLKKLLQPVKRQPVSTFVAADVGDVFAIGKSRFRLISADQTAAPAQPLSSIENWLEWLEQRSVLLILFVIGVTSLVFNFYFDTPRPTDVGQIVKMGLSYSAVGIGWSLFWASIGLMLFKPMRFSAHLSLWFGLTSIVFTLDTLIQIVTYNLNLSWVTALLDYAITGIMLLVFINIVFYLLSHLPHDQRWLRANALVWTIMLGWWFFDYDWQTRFDSYPEYASELQPPGLLFRPVSNTDDYLNSLDAVFEEAAQRRADPIPRQ